MKFVRPEQWFKRFYLGIARTASAPGARELQYTNLFRRDLNALGLADCYYPTGSAANGSLLYCLLRTVRESPVCSVLELGCGESTRLLNALRSLRPLEVLSVEDDAFWRDHIASEVDHEIVLCPLESRSIAGKVVDSYAWTEEILKRRFDLIVVDGPRATRRFSRWGALEIIENTLADDFVILVDDAERRGEADTIHGIQQLLERQGKRFDMRVLGGLQTQAMIFSEAMAVVRSF